MNQIIPFEAKVPAHITALSGVVSDDDLTSGVGGGYPVVSIKGKVFHMVRGDEKTLVTKPGGEDGEPAASIEVVILRANKNLSKVYYAQKYSEGSDEKPTCYSNNGSAPEADAQEPQSAKCATCVHNQWGSRITDSGSKGKACSDSRRIAVAPVGQLNDPMMLRIPAASLKPLAQYGEMLKKRGVKYPAVSTRIGFDYSVAHPLLTFKPVGFLSEDLALVAANMSRSDLVEQIIAGQGGREATPVVAAEPAKVIETNKTEAPKAEVPKQATPVEPKPKAGNKTTQASKLVEVDTASLEKDLDAVLSAAGFDD